MLGVSLGLVYSSSTAVITGFLKVVISTLHFPVFLIRFFFLLFGHAWHEEVPGPGIKPEPQQLKLLQ